MPSSTVIPEAPLDDAQARFDNNFEDWIIAPRLAGYETGTQMPT